MGKNYTINVKWWGKGTRQAFGGGNISKMNGNFQKNQEITSNNIRGVAKIGTVFKIAQMGNETVGAYTGDRLRQRKVQVGITMAKYGVGVAMFGPLGVAYMATDLGYRSLQYNIGINKQNREANYYKRLSGNNSNSGSRYRGDYA